MRLQLSLLCASLAAFATADADKDVAPYLTMIGEPESFAEGRTHSTFAAVYPQNPEQMVVSFRGDIGDFKFFYNASAPGAGVMLYDISNASNPTPTSWWKHDFPVEGQDRFGDTLVAVAMTTGKLYTFDLSTVTAGDMEPVGEVKFGNPGHMGLHVRIWHGPDGTYAIVNSGFSCGACVPGDGIVYNFTNDYAAGKSNTIWAIDISDPTNPREVGHLDLPDLMCPEGVLVVGGYAYIGGVNSQTFAVVDIRTPTDMKLDHEFKEDRFNQMVGETTGPKSYFSLWTETFFGTKGGISEWNTTDPKCLRELAYITTEECKGSNRIFLLTPPSMTDTFALIPLERGNKGGVCFVDVTEVGNPVLRQAFHLESADTTMYAIAAKDDYIYLMVEGTSKMRTYQVDYTKVKEGVAFADLTARLEYDDPTACYPAPSTVPGTDGASFCMSWIGLVASLIFVHTYF